MDFTQMTIGDIVVAITAVGVICGFMFKIFSVFNQVKTSADDIKKINHRIDDMGTDTKTQKDEILAKVEATNNAVNLLCSAISALIDYEISDNGDKNELREIKKRLDVKKEIV